MRIVVALGGNAMTAADGSAAPEDQTAAVKRAARDVVALLQAGHSVVLTHGNGPQVGDALLQNELAAGSVPALPLDWCGAQTQGTIGHILVNALEAAFTEAALATRPVGILTRALVSPRDPAFRRPTKPIGPYRSREHAERMMATEQTWEDRGERGWRRVVASPEPLEILDGPAIRALLDAGFLVVANGGGGVPVVRRRDGSLDGVEAVIDKDLGAVLLARDVRADALVIATDVEHAVVGWGTPEAYPLREITVAELRVLEKEGHFASGSMGPKVDAACRFVEMGGLLSVITSLTGIDDALARGAGTIVRAA